MTVVKRRKIFKTLQTLVVIFFLAAPFINTSNGYGILRFDTDLLRIYFFNNIITFDSFFITSLVILLSVFILILTTQIFGRIWCGWLCPQTFISKLIIDISNKFAKNYRKIVHISASFLFSFIISLNWMWYFITPFQFFKNGFGSTSFIIWIFLFIILFLHFSFVGFLWCKYLCPYAKMQSMMCDDGTLYIGLSDANKDKCMNCLACVRKCPSKIDPRKNPDNACVYCETCIITCNNIMLKRKQESCLTYEWGTVGNFNLKRPNLLITIAISFLLVCLLFYHIFENKPLLVKYDNIISKQDNNYVVTLKMKNGLSNNIITYLKSDTDIIVKPDSISLRAKENKDVIITLLPKDKTQNSFNITITTTTGYKQNININKTEK